MQIALQPCPPVIRFIEMSFFFSDTRLSLLWLVLRLYIGYQWLIAGYEKIINPVWVGSHAGAALTGFLMGSLKKATGEHPDVASWYASFIHTVVLPHAMIFSYVIACGELCVGIALILGIFTGIAAFFGGFMNMNYLFAGTLSINPQLLLLEVFLILAWRTAGRYGIDRWLLPSLGTPWSKGKAFKKK